MPYRTQKKYFAFYRSNSICSSHVIFLLIAGFRLFYAINNDDRFQIQLIFTMKCTRERFNWSFSDVAEHKKTSAWKNFPMCGSLRNTKQHGKKGWECRCGWGWRWWWGWRFGIILALSPTPSPQCKATIKWIGIISWRTENNEIIFFNLSRLFGCLFFIID